MSNHLKLLSLMTVLAAACGTPPEADATSDEGTVEEALATGSFSYVTIRRDFRRCMAPLCGGYWAKDVNKSTAEKYVSALDFSQSGLDAANRDLVSGAPGEELVLRGKLGKLDRGFQTRPLVITEAYRGLPGMKIAAGDAVYSIKDMRKLIRCFAAPCNGLTASKLATTSKTSFTGYSFEPALATLVDPAWLDTRLGEHGGLAAGHFEKGQKFPAGTEKLLETSQVFTRLPSVDGPCQPQPQARCAVGFVNAFERDGNRCLNTLGCIAQQFCRRNVPACEAGYTLQSWPGANGGCPQYACDPAWSVAAPQ